MSAPIFKSIFGQSWDQLPSVMRKHYGNHPYSDDVTIVEGKLDVMCAGPIKWFAPLLKFMGQIPPMNEPQVPTLVHFESSPNDKSFGFKRTFTFKNNQTYNFYSKMIQIKDNQVIEIMRFGLCWRMLYLWEDNKVKLIHQGYALRLFGRLIPLPLTVLLGRGYAEETAVDDVSFDMVTHITQPLWGKVYEYKGRFRILQTP